MKLDFFVWSCWINSITSLGMGIFLFLIRPHSRTKTLWGLFCVTVSIWSLGLGLLTGAPSEEVAIKAKYILYSGSSFFPTFLFHFVAEITNLKNRKNFIIATYLACAVFHIMNFSDQMVFVEPFWIFPYYFSPKWGFTVHSLIFYVIATYAIIALFLNYKNADPSSKKQKLLLFIGISAALIGGQMVIWPVYKLKIYPWGNFFVPAYVFCVTYSMLRYELWGFKIALKKFTLILFIYLCLFAISIPVLFPIIKSLYLAQPELLPYIVGLILIFTGIISSGPFIFAYILNRNYWLKNNLSTGLTHELKSPINAIFGASDLISAKLQSKSSSKQQLLEYTEIIQKNSQRLETFVTNLLNISKIQEGNLSLEKSTFIPKDLIHNLLSHYQPIAEQKKLKLISNIRFDSHITADKEKFEQVFSNLISNAIKYSENSEIKISLSLKNNSLNASVEDKGKGIPAEEIHKIFDRFYQSKNSAKGSGIGLTVAKAWVELHGGRIWAESEGEGKGTRVSFVLPNS